MQDDIERAKNLHEWNRRIFAILGVWPLTRSYTRFTVFTLYLTIHLATEMADFIQVFGNLDLMVSNLSESTLEIMIFAKIMVMRYSTTLRKVMVQIIDSIDERTFKNAEEKEIYLKYNRIAKSFFKLWFHMGFGAATVYYMKPLELRVKSAFTNESMPFVLPYRSRYFFAVNDSTTYWLLWIYQSPMIYIHAAFAITTSYVVTLVLHVSALLAILAHRIKRVEIGSRDDNPAKSKQIFRDIVETHCHIRRMAKDIETVFHLVLLEELFISTVIVGLTAYSGLANASVDDTAFFLSFSVYAGTMLYLIYGYCVAGQYLITESNNVHEAYYQCQWYDWSSSSKKHLSICMLGATKPIQLTGGGLYIFCSAGFTSVLKSAMGYISMLRTMI